ncbi:hypothetical protein [Flexivirga meconopsidis]|uniref:hypothetical protein n=1 Tax=Flexivirga meconopsidis TaxID=2977121 RepID=UPI00223F1B26|nr:hypothetical protein [Flexivirga meconopsidis]
MSQNAQHRKRSGVTRRSALAGVAAGLGTLGLAGTVAAPSRAAVSSTAASKAELAFLDRGLQHGAWAAQSSAGGRYVPPASAWNRTGFTMPTFYEPGQYNASLIAELGDTLWATAEAPTGGHMTSGPGSGPFLTAEQRANVGNLFSICLGDEEPYSSQIQTWTAQWAAKARAEAPNALIHTNQYSGQWSDAQLRSYIAAVQPDLLTWDDYYYSTSGNGRFNAGSVTPLYNDTWRYRNLALGGLDGNGTSPLNFGQYTLGYCQGSSQAGTGPRVPSQSELWLPSYVTWTLGGKWLNLFRWESGADYWLLNDSTGALTYFVDWYGELNAAMRRLSPYLVRLRSVNAGLVHGQYNNGVPVSTPESSIPAFSATTDAGTGVTGVRVSTVSPRNGGLPGDVLVGTFRPIPGLSTAQLGSYIPKPTTPFFMVVNAMGVANDDIYSRSSTGGESAANAQGITLTLNPSAAGSTPTGLRMLDPTTGAVSSPALSGSGSSYTTTVSIGAAAGCLFWWV